MSKLHLIESGVLTLGCGDLQAPPLFELIQDDGTRPGYEPMAAALVAAQLGLLIDWVPLEWSDLKSQ